MILSLFLRYNFKGENLYETSDKDIFSIPVSYTHLDVYKRQHHTQFGDNTVPIAKKRYSKKT